MINNLIKFELSLALNREPQTHELNSAIDCINNNEALIQEWADIRNLLLDVWRDRNYFKCQLCEEFHENDVKCTIHDDVDDGNYFCHNCIAIARKDAEFDRAFELGTDSRHTC